MKNWAAPTTARARDRPSRRNAASPNWTITSSSITVPAIQNVVAYRAAAGPPSRTSGVDS